MTNSLPLPGARPFPAGDEGMPSGITPESMPPGVMPGSSGVYPGVAPGWGYEAEIPGFASYYQGAALPYLGAGYEMQTGLGVSPDFTEGGSAESSRQTEDSRNAGEREEGGSLLAPGQLPASHAAGARRRDEFLPSDDDFFNRPQDYAAENPEAAQQQLPGRRPYEAPRIAGQYPNSLLQRESNNGRVSSALELPWHFELIAVVITALAISSLVRAFLLQTFYIPSQSMEQTLMVNDSVLVTKTAPRYRDLNRGDIIVFEDNENWLHAEQENVGRKVEQNAVAKAIKGFLIFVGLLPEDSEGYLIKRVIGLGKDNVACCDEDGMMTVNGKALDENYIPNTGDASETQFDVTVPPKHVWVMGDNRNHSADSRSHVNSASGGFIPLEDVVGRAFVVIWPLEHMRFISTSCAFYNIPKPVESVPDEFSSAPTQSAP